MEKNVSLHKMFITIFVLSLIVVFGAYWWKGFEVASLLSICWLTGVLAVVSGGIENTINKNK